MTQRDLRILRAGEIRQLLEGAEIAMIDLVKAAYEAHALGQSALPHSTFLRFPDDPINRIIALPAFLGGEFGVAGMKWIASFPANTDAGIERASAVIVLNSARTGRPEALLEGSLISARRTAASAALAARTLHTEQPATTAGLIGCGLINFETLRYLKAVFPQLDEALIYDTSPAHAEEFAGRCADLLGVRARPLPSAERVLAETPLVALATTAVAPHIDDLRMCPPGSTILHTSLRDIAPAALLRCDNIVDDIDHAVRANTSLHLAEQQEGRRDFVRCTLAEITSGRAPARPNPAATALYSPFGLGILDLALAQWVLNAAAAAGLGTIVPNFLP